MTNIKRKIFKTLKYFIYITCCLIIIFGYWLIFTSNGVQTLINSVPRVSQIQISASVQDGSLYRGIDITNIKVETSTANVSIEQLTLQWQPFALLSGKLLFPYLMLRHVEVDLPEQQVSEDETETLTIPDNLMAGLPVLLIDQFKLDNITLISAESETPFQLHQLDFQLAYADQQYKIVDLTVKNKDMEIKADANLGVLSPFQSNMHSQVNINLDELAPVVFDLTLDGDIDALKTNIKFIQRLQGHVLINIKDIMNDLLWDAQINLDKLALQQIMPDMPAMKFDITLDAAGDIASLHGQGKVHVSEDALSPVNINPEKINSEKINQGTNDSNTAATTKLINNHADFKLDFHAENPGPDVFDGGIQINWSELSWWLHEQQFKIDSAGGEINLNRLMQKNTLTALTNLRLNDIPLKVDLSLVNMNEHIAVEKLDITNDEVEINISGKIDQETQEVQLDSLWNIVDLNIPEMKERFNSSGEATISGTLDNYVVDSHATVSSLNIPKLDFSLPVKGNLNGLNIDNAELLALNGKLITSGELSWQEQLALNLNWQGEAINPGDLWPDWQGKLATSGEIEITKPGDVWLWKLQQSTLQGSLRNLPLAFNLSGHSVNEKSNNIALEGSYANAAVSVQGEFGDKLNLNWQLGSPDLSLVYPELGGDLNSSGQLSGSLDTPKIKAAISGKNILTPWVRSKAVAADISADLSLDALINADIVLKHVIYQSTTIDDLEIKLKGRNSQHQFNIHTLMPNLEVTLAGEGALHNKSWSGFLSTLDIEHETYKKWQLQKSTALLFSTDMIQLQPLCLMQSSASLCTDMMMQRQSQIWEVNASASEIPLNYLQQNIPETLVLNGSTQAQLHIQGKAERPLSGQGNVTIPNGSLEVAITDDVIKTIRLDQTMFDLKLENGLLTGKGELPVSGEEIKTLKTYFQIGDFNQKNLAAENLTIDAQLQAGITDLSLITAVVPQIIEVKGSLELDLLLKEKLTHPSYQGTMTLSEGGFSSSDLGIQIKNLEIKGNKLHDNQYEIKGGMTSGNGKLNLNTLIELGQSNSPEFKISLQGEKFEAVNLPELWALVSPDINGKWSANNESFQGSILIPEATINLDEVVVSSSTSEDEVIINEKIEAEATQANRNIKLQVTLGKAVTINGKGITGNLVGQLDLSTNKKGEMLGNGEILIDKGKYAAYGQELIIKEGRLIYRNAALDDPILSIVAVREVDDLTVGLKVSGYITNPEVSLFSSKSLPQEQMISYLVFGRPLSSLSSSEGSDLIGAAATLGLRNSGMITEKVATTFGLDEFTIGGASAQSASVSVGKYLNPKLYLSYGLGIFDKLSTVRLRYELSRRFSVETESGSEMGADIFYRIEK